MNFPGRFDPKASDAAYVSLDGDQFSLASNTSAASPQNTGSGNIIVPDSHLLFSGDYKRAGNDLVLSSGDKNYVVYDYFKGDKRSALISADGATLSGSIVTALTGHTQYAQAGAPASGQVVGSVMKLTGSASAIRNGVAIQLNIGDAVQKGDVIQTGSDSSIGLTLADGTVFGMSSNARMVLNELIYDPNGSSNSSLFSLVQGTITFVAGQTAKNGNMRVDTPVATMGIRGTAVLVEISSNDGPTKFSVLLEPDGKTGSFNLYDKVTGQLLGTVSQAGQVTFVSPMGVGLPALATELPKTLSDLQAEKQLIQQVFQLYFPNYTPDDSRPNSTKTGPRTDIGVPENVIGKYAINPDTGRATITYTVPVTNPDTHQTSNVNIVYTNTPPSFATTNAFDEQSTVLGPNSFKLGDHVTITDPDIGVAPFFDVPFRYVANTGQIAQATGPSSVPGTYLVGPSLLTLNTATGVVTYNPSAFRFLGEGEKAVYKFTFIAASGVGGSGSDAASQTVYLTVTGQNDAPLFAVNDTPLSFDETAHQIGQSTAHLIVPIELHFTDEDFSDVASTFTLSKTVATNVAGDSMTTPDLSKLPGNVTLASYLTIDSTIDSATGVTRTALSNAGIVTGKFSAPDNVFDFLAEGEQVQLVYTITISDGHAGSTPSTQTVTITVTGTNDTPEVSVANDTFGLNESTGATIVADVLTLTSSGSVHFTDADLNDTHSTSKPVLSTAVWLKPDGQGGYVSAGTIPTDTMNAVATAAGAAFVSDSTGGLTGQVNWNFALADSLVDFLAENETLTLVYNVVVNDGHTDVGIATQPITIVITGTNDTPTVAAPLTITATEGGAPIVCDLLDGAADLDNGETATLTVENIKYSVNGGVQTTTAPDGITFPNATTINVDAAGFDHIAGGATETIVVTYDVTDVHGATVEQTETITIAGVNDRPILAAGTDLTPITEDETANNGQTVASFATGISDVDDGAQQGIAITEYTSSHGQWQFSTNGGSTWTNFGTYSPTEGLLLASDDMVRFVPDAENGSVDTLTYVAWDRTTGTRGLTADSTAGGDSSAFSQDSQTATITVTDVNDAPVISSNGGGTTATITVDENTTSVTTVQATNVDGPNVTFEIVTGLEWPDANKFAINPTTGELTFVNPPDFEAYGSANGDNTYRVQVRATDGTLTDTQTLTVNVADVVEGPTYLVYSTLNDESPGTLRSAILFANANPNTTITFVAGGSWNGAWVLMVNDLPAITGDGTVIDGMAGAAQVLLQANGSPSRIFTVGNGVDNIDVTIRNIGMRYGAAEKQDGSNAMGGAIYVAENVHLRIENNVFINQSHAASWNGGSAFGGAIYLGDDSTLELKGRVEITQNDAYVSGTDINGIPGVALGDGIYVAGPNGTIILRPDQGTTILLGNEIANGPANGGVQNLVVNGAGVVDINAVSSFSGTTDVFNGTLLVNYQGQLLNSAVTIHGQGVLVGGGSQPMYATGVGDLVVTSGGVFAPSYNLSTAVFRTGSLILESGAKLAMDANGGSPGAYSIPGNVVGHDQVLVYGTVTINGATLELGGVNGYYFYGAIGANFTIIDNDGNDAVVGAFAGKAEGSTFYSGGDAYTITYHGGDGNDVVVTRVADPPIIDLNGLMSGTGALVNYTEGTVLRLVPDAILLDNDQTYLPSGSLTVAITQNGSGSETFSIEVGGPNNPLSANGSWIAHNGTNIASFSGGMNGNPLVINFRAMGGTPTYYGPTPAEIAEILKHITIAIPADNNPQSLTRQITFTVQDGEGGQSSALASVNVLDVGSAPIAGDDTISMRSDYGALKSTLITNDFDPDDQPSEKNFEISGAAHLVPDVSSTPATPITGGFKAEGKYGTLFLYSVATFDPIFNATANAGDYVFNVGRDINGNLLPGSQLAPIYDLAPGELLKDFFTYTITDPSNNTSAPALITVNFEAGPVSQHVERATGYNVTQLWDDIHFGTLTSISPTQLIVENAGRSIAIDAKNLTWGTIETEIVLTGGLIKGFHATDGSGALFDATGYNINAADFDSAVSNVSPVALYNILKTYGYDIHGGPGADGLLGGDLDPNGVARDDRIDTGGGADSVLAFGGNDLIVIYDNKAWQIDGGAGIDTIRLDGQFDLINGPSSQGALKIEIFDLNQTDVNSIGVDPEGVYQINADHAVRVLGNAQDTVALQKASSGYWEKSNSHVAYSGDYATAGTYFDLYSYVGGPSGTQAALYVQEGVGVRTDVLNGDAASAIPDGNGTTTVVNVVLNDPYQNANYAVSATASFGSVTLSSNGASLDQGAVSANVATINSELGTGIVYTPDTPSSPTDEIYDNVSLTVVDTWGISDTLNFVFRQQGTGSATLTGTNDKDIIFSTENNDTLTGLSGKDNFVFANSSGHDIVTDFQVGIDHLVLNDYSAQFTAGDQTSFLNWRDTSGHVQQSGNDTIIDLDPLGTNTITLQNVQKASLSMNDFILHPGGGLGV